MTTITMVGKKKYKNIHQKNRMRFLIVPNRSTLGKKATIPSSEVDKQETIDSMIEETKPVHPDNADTEKKLEDNNKGPDSNTKGSFTIFLWIGAMGAMVTLALVVLTAFIVPCFRFSSYYVNEDPSLLRELLSSNLSYKDSLNVTKAIIEETTRRKEIVEDLLDQGVIVSSEDFASNLSGYYNALIAVLAAVLVILNLFGFFAWRTNAAEALEQEKRKLSNEIENIDNRLENNLEEILRKNQAVREKLESYFQRLIEQIEPDNNLTEDDWEKLALLLKKYKIIKKENILVENNPDDGSNDGSIEEA